MRARSFGLPVFLLAACGEGLPGPIPPGDLTLTVTSPMAGDEMVAADHPTIVVTGMVTTTSAKYGVLGAWVNGAAAELDGSGGFSAQVAPEVGINHLKVEAGDGAGTMLVKEMDVMWAPEYLPQIAGTAGYQVPGGLDLDLGQGFFDSRMFGTTLDLTTDPVVAHDLASALELILWNVNLASLINGGIHIQTSSSQLDINIPSVTPAEIIADARITNTSGPALELEIDLNGVFLATTGSFHYNNRTLQIDGGLSADMHATVRLDMGALQDGTISVTATNVTADLGALVPMFTGPNANELDGFINVGNNDFRQLIETMIRNQLIPTFTDKLPPLLQSLLGATDSVLDNVSFTLDAKLGTAVTTVIDGRVGSLDVLPGPAIGQTPGHITVHQTVSVQTSNAPIHAASRGAARVASTPEVPVTNSASMHVLMQQDFLNTLLHALWNAGLLEGTASVGGINATVSAKLQPFVRPTPDSAACIVQGSRCDITLQLGQLEVGLPDYEQSFAINAQAGARVIVDGTTVSIVIQDVPTLTVWETSAVPGRLTPDAIKDLVANVVWPELFGAISDKLKINLPIPDLAALGLDTLSPNLANAKLELDVKQRASVTEGYLGLGGDIQLQTPHP